jgi:cytochrome c peroxidase
MKLIASRRERWNGGSPLAVAAVAFAFALGCGKEPAPSVALRAEPSGGHASLITPIARPSGLDPARVALGEKLFQSPLLSGSGSQSCASCHDLSHAGVDSLPHPSSPLAPPASINTPTVFNSALNFRQFWDGRALTLEDQVDGPLLNPAEMDSSWPQVLSKLQGDADLAARFRRGYKDGVTVANVKDAVATFERSLATPDAPFDRYLAGDTSAIDPTAARGYELFTNYGCSACHQGQGVGGNMFQQLGVMADYFGDHGQHTQADLGRFNVTHDEADKYVFKVPSLRNVARTAPYFHDGSVAHLDDAVRLMARYQVGRDLDDADVGALVAFLGSLTGTYQGRPL